MSCGTITRGSSVAECDELPPAGTRSRLILINYDDILIIYTNDDQKIISIVLRSQSVGGIDLNAELNASFTSLSTGGAGAFEFIGFRNDVKKSEEVVKREKSKQRFIHSVSFVVYEVDQLQKTNIKNMARGRFLAIVESKGQGDDSIEVLGKECGLQIVDGQIRNAHENGGVFVLSLATPNNGVEFERKLPQTLGTSYGHGISIIDDLLEEEPEVPTGEGIFDETFDLTFE